MIRQELKEKFLQELTALEKDFFLMTAREAIRVKRYLPSEDLFFYCYFMTVKERMKAISPSRGNAFAHILCVEASKDIDDVLTLYIGRLEDTKGTVPHSEGNKFIEHFSSSK